LIKKPGGESSEALTEKFLDCIGPVGRHRRRDPSGAELHRLLLWRLFPVSGHGLLFFSWFLFSVPFLFSSRWGFASARFIVDYRLVASKLSTIVLGGTAASHTLSGVGGGHFLIQEIG
jgi:hypothetical protein